MPENVSLVTEDGQTLEAELTVAADERALAVLCHPHPQYGGDMRSLVTSELFGALPGAGVTCLRFNFRGVGRSTGTYDGGNAEQLDVHAAVTWAADRGSARLALVGWSFGADLALTESAPALAGWVAIAPPLRFGGAVDRVGLDTRPKLLILAQHDEFRDAATVVEATEAWRETTTEIVPGASHFFVGRTARVVELVTDWIGRLP
jgi:uncharacterized protein